MVRERCGFLHIPKTAGSSVRSALQRAYPGERTSRYVFDDVLFGGFSGYDTFSGPLRTVTLLPGDTPDRTDSSLVLGHFSLHGITRLIDPSDVFTVLREPRARLLSHQSFWAMSPDEVNVDYGDYQVHRLAFDGLRRFLEHDAAAHQHDNLACRMLAPAALDLPRDRPMTPGERDTAVDAAVETLARLGMTTFVESPRFWADIAGFVGLDGPEPRENITDSGGRGAPFRGAQLDRHTIDLLEERTAGDMRLFRHVVTASGDATERDAQRIADAAFAAQAERYGRLVAAAEHEHLHARIATLEASLQRRSVRVPLAIARRLRGS